MTERALLDPPVLDLIVVPKRTEADIAWAAGLFEGEGCIVVYKAPKLGGMLTINMTDLDVLQKFHGIVGSGTLRGPYRAQKVQHKPHYTWTVARWAHVEQIVHDFYPYLGQRRRAKADALYAQPVVRTSSRQPQVMCKRGHPLEGDGADVLVRWTPDGSRNRQCRRCASFTRTARRIAERITLAGGRPHEHVVNVRSGVVHRLDCQRTRPRPELAPWVAPLAGDSPCSYCLGSTLPGVAA